jgi:hypothetical protein
MFQTATNQISNYYRVAILETDMTFAAKSDLLVGAPAARIIYFGSICLSHNQINGPCKMN